MAIFLSLNFIPLITKLSVKSFIKQKQGYPTNSIKQAKNEILGNKANEVFFLLILTKLKSFFINFGSFEKNAYSVLSSNFASLWVFY